MTAPPVVVTATGVANTASVLAGLERAGAAPRLSEQPEEVATAPFAVLPGVGAFAAGMERLAGGLGEALVERIRGGRPTLCICLGMQMLSEGSAEAEGCAGLGLVPGVVSPFPDTVTVPQLGWNRIRAGEGCSVLGDGFVYFAHSYRLTGEVPGWAVACADHGGTFVAGIERGPVVGCQFHPELSGAFGQEMLRRWLQSGGGRC